MTGHIEFGSKQIVFELEYTERKTLGITVTSDMEVLVRAPLDTPMDHIQRKLLKKAPWIIRQQSFFLSFHPKTPERKFIGGETHLYLGRQYCLKIITGEPDSIKLKGRYLEVVTSERLKVRNLVNTWYLKNAEVKLCAISEPLIEQFYRYSVTPSSIVLQDMPTRWGSCTPRGKIILNPNLIKAPRGCIEYVITHELCHLVYHDHNRKFIELQTKVMPDWEKWKSKLERLLA